MYSETTPSIAKHNNELLDQFRKITIEPRKDEVIEQIIAQRINLDIDVIHYTLNYVKRYTPLQKNFKTQIHIFDIYKKTNDLKEAIREVTTIPLPLNQVDNDFILNLEKNLKLHIYGQEEAISLVSSACVNYLQSLNNPLHPIGVFLFVGPTGTGKTELSLSIANLLFKGNCIRLNMVDFQGYVYVETIKKILSEKLLSNPFSVVLLDEVDFTESKTLAFFMTVFDAGYFTDSLGNIVDCRQALFLMTSNFQAEIIQNNKNTSLQKEMESFARKRFTPQFVGRINQIIIFNPLSSENIRALISKELEKIKQQLICFPHFFHFEWDVKAISYLENNYEREEGVRSIQKALNFVNSNINNFVLQNNRLNNFKLTIKNEMLYIQPLKSIYPEFI